MNQVGGQDELVFDGGSFVINGDGTLARHLPLFQESIVLTRWRHENGSLVCEGADDGTEPPRSSAIYSAMMVGLRDYVVKNRFPGVSGVKSTRPATLSSVPVTGGRATFPDVASSG